MEENKELSSESVFIKRKARELAKCVLKIREDHRVFMLQKKIEVRHLLMVWRRGTRSNMRGF